MATKGTRKTNSTSRKGKQPTKKRSATATEIKKQREQAMEQPAAGGQFKAILLFAFAILILFLVLIEGESVWNSVHKFLFGTFGICVYAVPFFIGFIAIISAMEKMASAVVVKTVESSLMVLFLGAAIDIFSSYPADLTFNQHLNTAYERGIRGGGFLGALIGEPINMLCGTVGAGVIICLAIFVVFMLLSGITLIGLFRGISQPVRKAKEKAGESYSRDIEARKEHGREIGKERRRKPPVTDIPVDDIPEEVAPPETLGVDEKGKKLIDVYHNETFEPDDITINEAAADDDSVEHTIPPSISEVIEESGALAEDEPETAKKEKQKPVTEGEIKDFTNEVIDNSETAQDEEYRFPPVNLLKENTKKGAASGEKELKATAENLVNVLRSFGVETRIVDVTRGPTVTRYELQPSAGVKISKITSLADDIALNLAAAGVRIEAPIPNKAAIGIEVPNKATTMVGARDIIETVEFMTAKSKLTAALGKDISGTAILTDIAKMPHGLIAGSTGSGKSVCINSIIISLLYKATPDDVKLLMIDPKVVELGVYNGIPHLLVPVVTDPRKAAGALGWAVQEMEKRYRLFAECNVRNLEGYNHLAEMSEDLPRMPHIVIIIDELADLMATSSKEVKIILHVLPQRPVPPVCIL